MNLPTAGLWLAQIEVPYDQLLQAQLGTLALILAIVLVITIGTAVVLVVKLLNRMTDNVQESQKLSASVQLSINASRAEVSASQAAFTHAVAMNTDEMKRQTAVLLELQAGLRSQIEKTVETAAAGESAKLAAHDEAVVTRLERIETKLGTLSDEIKAGHKVSRAEMVEQIGLVLAEIATLKTPPPEPTPPVAVSTFTVVERPAEPAQEKAA